MGYVHGLEHNYEFFCKCIGRGCACMQLLCEVINFSSVLVMHGTQLAHVHVSMPIGSACALLL